MKPYVLSILPLVGVASICNFQIYTDLKTLLADGKKDPVKLDLHLHEGV